MAGGGGSVGFRVRDRVRVKVEHDDGNPRVPRYVRGKEGTVLDAHGVVPGYQHDHADDRGALYSVIFECSGVFGHSSNETVVVDIHEGWLEASSS